MDGYQFYITQKFLCRATKESYSHPKNLDIHRCAKLSFKLFMYKIIRNTAIAWLTLETLKKFKLTEDYGNFSNQPLIHSAYDEDKTIIIGANDEYTWLRECAAIRSGLGDFGVYIICLDDEYDQLKAISEDYPIKIITIEEALKLEYLINL